MASKKTKSAEIPVRKAVTSKSTTRVVVQPAALATEATGNSQRLLREAAWSRMFGRADTKNPFAR